MKNTTIHTAIDNLEKTSIALEEAANSPKHYNTDYAHYLAIMSLELRQKASMLRECDYILGNI